MSKILLVLCFLYVSLISVINAQSFKSLNSEFPIAQVRSMLQDSYGFLWLGTNNGLVKYNGYSIQTYTRDPADSMTLAGQSVTAVAEDRFRRMWVGQTNTGVQVFDRNTERFQSICLLGPDSTCVDLITTYAIEPQGDLMWVGTNRGLYAIDIKTLKCVRSLFGRDNEGMVLTSSNIMSLCASSDGSLWVGCVNGLNRIRASGDFVSSFRTNNSYPKGQIPDIGEAPDGTIWVSGRTTPFRLYKSSDEKDLFTADSTFTTEALWGNWRFDFDGDGQMYISARSFGALIYDPLSREYETFRADQGVRHGMQGYYNYPALVDSYGNFWTGGVQTYIRPGSRKDFRGLYTEGYYVTTVFADDNWIWYGARRPFRIGHLSTETEAFMAGVELTNLRGGPMVRGRVKRLYKVLQYDENTIAFTTTRNLYLWNTRNDSYKEFPTNKGGPFRDFELGAYNDAWFAVNQGSVHHMDLATGESIPITDGARQIQYSVAVSKDKGGNLWWGGSTNGVWCMSPDGDILDHIPLSGTRTDTSLYGYRIHDVHVTVNGLLCVATDLGLTVCDILSNELKYYGTEDGLKNEVVSSVTSDEDGAIWGGTKFGLFRLNPETSEIRTYTNEDGLLNTQYIERAVDRSSDGRLYFGGDRGIDYFDPKRVGINPIAPSVMLDQIRVNNRLFKPDSAYENVKSLKLTYDENFIEISVLGLHLTAPSSTRYEYRIDNGEWISLGTSRVITLANTSPGNYIIQARASNADHIWSEDVTILDIQVTPPWWQTFWFYSVVGLCTALMVLFIYRRRVARIEKEQQRKSEINKMIAEIEMKALRAQMNPHFIFNSLNSVQSLIVKGKTEDAVQYLTSFSKLIRVVLNNSRSKQVKLADDLEAVELYLKLEQLRFKNFVFSVSVDESIDAHFVKVPPMLIQPYVENAIWHGIAHNEGVIGEVAVNIKRNGEMLEFHIIDNGIGRENARKLQTRSRSKQESLGMRITEDRLAMLTELYGDKASVMVSDLSDPTGTHVIVQLPIPE